MGNHTVNDKKRRYSEEITERQADSTDKLNIVYVACGKEPDEKKKMKAKENKKEPEYSLIDHLRKNGEIVAETPNSASIKVYPNKETTKNTTQHEELAH